MEMKAFVLVQLGFEFKKLKLWKSKLANIHRKESLEPEESFGVKPPHLKLVFQLWSQLERLLSANNN